MNSQYLFIGKEVCYKKNIRTRQIDKRSFHMQTREQPTNRRSRKAAKRRRRIIIRVSILLLLLIALGFGVYKGLGALVPALSDAIFSDKPK